MKYLRLFKNDAECQAFIVGEEYITPNICLNEETGKIKCKKYIAPVVGGDIYVETDYHGTITLHFDTPKTWEECIGMRDTTGEFEIIKSDIYTSGNMIECMCLNILSSIPLSMSARLKNDGEIYPLFKTSIYDVNSIVLPKDNIEIGKVYYSWLYT